MNDEEKYSGSEDNLLEDFESELAAEDKARKKRRNLVIMGVIAGAALWLILSSGEEDEPPAQKAAQPSEANIQEAEPTDIEKQIAKLHEQNRINEDFKAPGALMRDEPMEPAAPEQAAEPEPARAEVAEISQTPDIEPETTAHPEPEVKQAPEPKITPKKKAVVTASTVPAAPEKREPYAVQIMATMDALAALELRDELLKNGFDSWISMGKSKQNIYRVEAGEFKSIREASALSAEMAQAGFVTRTAYIKNGTKVTLIAGMFEDKRRADRLNDQIASAGFLSRIMNRPEAQTLYMVRVGRYKTSEEAARVRKTLNQSGFLTLGITQ